MEAGTLTPQTLVWTRGMAGWEPAAKALPALFKGPGLPPALPAGGPPWWQDHGAAALATAGT